ncbi:MAG: OsmC family protein [Bdellovibrionales bacterium]|nr:OsmC family protein [Bdellovibrionales bacterium]
MIKYPISFFARANSLEGIQSAWTVDSQNLIARCAIPPEFEGPGGALSPEDLFAQALRSCFVATFKVYAEKSKISFSDLTVQTQLVADLDASKKPVMKKCLLQVSIRGCATPERVKTLAEKAFKSGFILNSVKTELHLELDVS